ncbi:MAG TPA: ABC transporter substrate-binding protein, partial [Acidimicrobiales bacterium]|nr:ABC transporter substrate-binding protein [Acidimicrobiales bacterium]
TARGRAPGTVGPCADRGLQVPQDPYSPPCYAFTGDNGGATSRGVTRDTITVTIRSLDLGSPTEIFSALGGQDLQEPTETGNETAAALAEYFSQHFQFYGRKLEMKFFEGDGDGLEELLSGGKEEALRDATRASQELLAFADVGAITIPYADALAQQRVINIGSPYPSQEWYETRRPYSWSVFSDGTNLVSATSSAMIGRFPPGSRAEHAGPALRDEPRRFAVVAPENPEYQESMAVLIARLRAAGIEVVTNQKYKLDLVSFPNQASNIIAQIKDAGVTSVVCICDPAMLAFGLTLKANEQSYEPEWITAGIVFVEQDVVSQLIDTTQWSHAFGTAYNAYSEPFGASFPYYAYKSVRPNDEPVRGVEEIYYLMYVLAIGIQMAGPNLTPESFEAGMFAYPDRFGPRGTWDFGPGDYTPTNDYREIWWDPDRTSTQNQRQGAWAQLDNGRRYTPEHPPRGRAPFFEEG